MQKRKVMLVVFLGVFCLSMSLVDARAQDSAAESGAPGVAQAEMEEFLLDANVDETQTLSRGVTGAMLANLSRGDQAHQAQIQTVDIFKPTMKIGGQTIRNFRDSYRYNIAAYELDKMLGTNLVPATVARPYKGKKAAFTVWVAPVMMTEATRMANNAMPPDAESWNFQINRIRVFTQLIYDTDPNLGNLLITSQWRLWKVDLTRSFRQFKQLMDESKLLTIDQDFYDALKTLTLDSCKETLGDQLSGPEIKGLLARRDLIIEIFDVAAAAKGRDAVITTAPSD